MKERPILFSAPMVRAILAGTKTQTRRIIKNPINNLHTGGNPVKLFADWPLSGLSNFDSGVASFDVQIAVDDSRLYATKCPYGVPGDRLWVRETWRTGAKLDNLSPKEIEEAANEAGYTSGCRGPLWYQADGKYRQWGDCDKLDFGEKGKPRPSLFMPRWASRLTLEIVSVRVERLQDISEEDAVAEGIAPNWCGPLTEGNDGLGGVGWKPEIHGYMPHDMTEDGEVSGCDPYDDLWSAKRCYQRLWESINGPGSWDANPWVWVVEFKKMEAQS